MTLVISHLMELDALNIPGARKPVEVQNPRGIFYKIRMGGDVLRRQRGAWIIPLRNGKDARLKARGLIPGFQALYLDGEQIYDMGAGVGRIERIAMFAPILLIFWPPAGLILALGLFFLGLPGIKNLQIPRPIRIALPIVHLLAGALILYLLWKATSGSN
jgi:hypothetical protein